MAIFREVKTEVYCDVCGKYIISWKSKGEGGKQTMGGVLCKAKRLYHRKTDYLQGVPDKEKDKGL